MVRGRHADQHPAWKIYKNRKKTIRDRYGPVAALGPGMLAAREAELHEARKRYEEGMLTESAAAWAATRRLGAGFLELVAARVVELADHGAVNDGNCDESCIGARGPVCRCQCEGANHGLAWGTPLGSHADRALERLRRAVEAGHDRAARRAAEQAHLHGADGSSIAAELAHWHAVERTTPTLARSDRAGPPERVERRKPGPKPGANRAHPPADGPYELTDAEKRRVRRRRAARQP